MKYISHILSTGQVYTVVFSLDMTPEFKQDLRTISDESRADLTTRLGQLLIDEILTNVK